MSLCFAALSFASRGRLCMFNWKGRDDRIERTTKQRSIEHTRNRPKKISIVIFVSVSVQGVALPPPQALHPIP